MTTLAYNSHYTDKKITVAQRLAELMCERLARKDGYDLSWKFWENVKWKRVFLRQVQIANALLKIYKQEAILKVLSKNPKVYSLNAQFLDPLYAAEQEHLLLIEQKVQPSVEEVNTESTNPTIRKPFIEKKSTLSKLRELDG